MFWLISGQGNTQSKATRANPLVVCAVLYLISELVFSRMNIVASYWVWFWRAYSQSLKETSLCIFSFPKNKQTLNLLLRSRIKDGLRFTVVDLQTCTCWPACPLSEAPTWDSETRETRMNKTWEDAFDSVKHFVNNNEGFWGYGHKLLQLNHWTKSVMKKNKMSVCNYSSKHLLILWIHLCFCNQNPFDIFLMNGFFK